MNLILIAGQTGQGKTPYLNETFLKNKHIPPVPPIVKGKYYANSESNRQYIFDVNNEYLLPDDYGQHKPQMRHTEMNIKKFISVASSLKNTNVVIEDATGFLRGRQSEDFARMLTAKMFTQNNYIIIFHSINRIPPELMEMANYLVLFKTNDNIDIIDTKFKDERINAAFIELKDAPRFSKKIIKII